MKVYNCIIKLARINDIPTHTVPKENLTEKELFLLREIHGQDSVGDIVESGDVPEIDERFQLFSLAKAYGQKRVEEVFKKVLYGYEDWLMSQLAAEEEEMEQRARARQESANPKPAQNIIQIVQNQDGSLSIPQQATVQTAAQNTVKDALTKAAETASNLVPEAEFVDFGGEDEGEGEEQATESAAKVFSDSTAELSME